MGWSGVGAVSPLRAERVVNADDISLDVQRRGGGCSDQLCAVGRATRCLGAVSLFIEISLEGLLSDEPFF